MWTKACSIMVILMATLAGASAAPDNWNEFCGHGLCVMLPGIPAESSMKTRILDFGEVRLRHYVVTDDRHNKTILASYGHYPHEVFDVFAPQAILDAIFGNLVFGLAGVVQIDVVDTRSGVAAQEYSLTAKNGVNVRARIYVLKPSVRVVAIFSKTAIDNNYAAKIFKSFNIIDIDHLV